jgi:ribosomal protein S27AE
MSQLVLDLFMIDIDSFVLNQFTRKCYICGAKPVFLEKNTIQCPKCMVGFVEPFLGPPTAMTFLVAKKASGTPPYSVEDLNKGCPKCGNKVGYVLAVSIFFDGRGKTNLGFFPNWIAKKHERWFCFSPDCEYDRGLIYSWHSFEGFPKPVKLLDHVENIPRSIKKRRELILKYYRRNKNGFMD